ncbi:hypothetical protein ACHAWF_014320 [Thalassiosira exigua]
MRILEPLRLLFLGASLPARAWNTVADGYDRVAARQRAAPNATRDACAPPSPDPLASDVPSSSTSSSSSRTDSAPPSALASSALAEEGAGLEDALALLRPAFESLRTTSGEDGGVFPEDPIFGTYDAAGVAPHDVEMTLIRYLRAARASSSKRDRVDARKVADEALDRIRKTLEYRREYDVLSMHAPGMARKLMLHDTNPGACMYLADAGVVDKKDQPVLVGRLGLMMSEDAEQHEPIVPANHLRAVLFAFERMAASLKLDRGQRRGIYILDCGMDRKSAPDLYDAVDSRPRFWSNAGRLIVDGLTMSGWKDKGDGKRTIPGVLPHLEHHATIDPGLSVLREALRQLTEHYPDVMERVYFVRPPLSFRAFVKVFSLMVDQETAEKFVVVPAGYESTLLERVASERLPSDFGGEGPGLGRDDFLKTALARYEAESLASRGSRKRRAEERARHNDARAGVAGTRDEAVVGGGKVVRGARAKLFSTSDRDEAPLGEFSEHTELVVARDGGDGGRHRLMWPVGGFVEVEA